MDLAEVINLAISGVTTGAIYGLLAVGFNVIFATTGVLNIAQGDFFMAGGMLGSVFLVTLGWPIPAALLATVVVVGLLGVLEEWIAVRPAIVQGHGSFGWLLSTLGFAIGLRAAFGLIMGPETRPFPPLVSDHPTNVGDVQLVPQQLLLPIVLVVLATALHTFYVRTLQGRALRAVAQDADAAAIRGLPVRRLSTISFLIGAAVAGLAGFVAAPITTAYTTIGFSLALKGFVAAALGGIPEIKGAAVGGLALGLIEVFGVELIGPAYRDAVVFAVLVVVLAARPTGLFGRLTARTV